MIVADSRIGIAASDIEGCRAGSINERGAGENPDTQLNRSGGLSFSGGAYHT